MGYMIGSLGSHTEVCDVKAVEPISIQHCWCWRS